MAKKIDFLPLELSETMKEYLKFKEAQEKLFDDERKEYFDKINELIKQDEKHIQKDA